MGPPQSPDSKPLANNANRHTRLAATSFTPLPPPAAVPPPMLMLYQHQCGPIYALIVTDGQGTMNKSDKAAAANQGGYDWDGLSRFKLDTSQHALDLGQEYVRLRRGSGV